nr:MAG TPA: hypothetical protein [Caudoviricetes sp.]
MKTAIIVIIILMGYSFTAGAWIAGLQIAAEKYVPGCSRFSDWPKFCGIFWPFAGPAAAVYILSQAYAVRKNSNERGSK